MCLILRVAFIITVAVLSGPLKGRAGVLPSSKVEQESDLILVAQRVEHPIDLTGREKQHDEDWFIEVPAQHRNLADRNGNPGYVLELEVRNVIAERVDVQLWFKNERYKNVYAYPVVVPPKQQQIIRFNPASDRHNVHEFSDFSRIAAVGAKVWGQRGGSPPLVQVLGVRLLPASVAAQSDPKRTAGEITTPSDGSRVSSQFPANGTVGLSSSEFGWVAVRKGSLIWPKEPAITRSGPWTLTVFEGGPPGKLSLVLIVVDEAGHREFVEWFARGHQTGSFPGIALHAGIEVIDEVNDLAKLP